MKLLYIANTRIPTEMAHGLQIMKMCEAFAKQGADLELVVPIRFAISKIAKEDPFQYYKVDKVFKIKKLFCLDLTPLNRFLGPISFGIQAVSFSFFVFLYLLFKKNCIVYGRDRFGLFFVSFVKNFIFEVHKNHRLFFKGLLERANKLVAISEGVKSALIKKGILEQKILLASDGIDLDDFNVSKSREECRKELGLPLNKKIVLYTGHLYKWKGVETLARASEFLDENILIVIVGGIKWYLSDFKKFIEKNNLKNILVVGYKDYSLIPKYLKSADCLVLTGNKESEISREQTSPMKMFEYMASKKPIVASSLLSFKEILNEYNCIFVESDNAEAMAIGIKKALNDSVLSENISNQAYQDVQKYTWDNRAKKILDFICVE